MLDFEENKRYLQDLKLKLQELGESLWHFKFKGRIKVIRRKDKQYRFLARFTK